MRPQDGHVLASYRNDPQIADMQNWTLPYPLERAQALLADQAEIHALIDPGWTQLGIELDGRVIGDLAVQLFDIGVDAHGVRRGGIAEIGYTLTPEAHGHGYATEAAEAMVAALFASGRIHRITAELSPRNRASMRVLERIGLRYESTSRNTFLLADGTWEDDLHYAADAEEWAAWQHRQSTPPANVDLVELTEGNIGDFAKLETHWSQRSFVTPMADSFADALADPRHEGHPVTPWLRGIAADGEPAGFVMLADVNEHHPQPYLWRLLIDRRHQRRGIGQRVIAQLADRCRSMRCTQLFVSWVPSVPGTPEPFYRQLGFEPTGEIDDGEVVAVLRL